MDSPRERSSSFTSQHSTSSPPRLSIDKRHSMERRSSTDSTIRTPLPNLPGVSSLPGISSNSPLAPAGSRGMPPPTPPKDRLPPPQTPTRKPVQRQKSPLSSEAFSSASPAPSMPGAFPATPSPGPPVGLPSSQFNTTAYSANNSPAASTPDSKAPGKRASSLRGLLPFKALRKSYDNTSPNTSPKSGMGRPSSAFGMRPQTPSGESLLSKSTNPSLRKKVSGSFWRRKSSFLNFDGGADVGAAAVNGTGSVNTNGIETLVEEQPARSATPGPGDEIMGVKKRKSGTFWKRRSSLNMLDRYNETQQNGTDTNGAARTNGHTNGHTSGSGDVVMGGTEEHTGYSDDYLHGANRTASAVTRTRSDSPPPQLPAFVGGGEGLGLTAEDLFKAVQ